jgi:hypothetical protein
MDHWGIRFDLYSANQECGVTDIVSTAREHVLGILYEVPLGRSLHRGASAPPWTKSRALDLVGSATTSDRKSGFEATPKPLKPELMSGLH